MTRIKKHWKDILFWVLFFMLPMIDRLISHVLANLLVRIVIWALLMILGYQTIKRDFKKIYRSPSLIQDEKLEEASQT